MKPKLIIIWRTFEKEQVRLFSILLPLITNLLTYVMNFLSVIHG